MQVIFTQKEIEDALKLRRVYRTVWIISLAVVLAALIGMFALFIVMVNVHGDRTMQTPFMILSIVISMLFIGSTIFFYDLKYRTVNALCKMFKAIREGEKESNHGTVMGMDKSWTQKEDVWFFSLIVECPPVRREQQNIRYLLIEKNRVEPPLSEGDEINFISYSNILVGYEKINASKEELN